MSYDWELEVSDVLRVNTSLGISNLVRGVRFSSSNEDFNIHIHVPDALFPESVLVSKAKLVHVCFMSLAAVFIEECCAVTLIAQFPQGERPGLPS